jgi:hypothetical protein
LKTFKFNSTPEEIEEMEIARAQVTTKKKKKTKQNTSRKEIK